MPGRVAHGTYAHDLGRRHPFEVAMLVAAVAVGASRVLSEPTSGSLERALSPFLISAWYLLLTLGSVIALTGIYWREPGGGLLIERAGLTMLTSAGLVYGVAITATAGWRGLAAAMFVFGFSVASLIRALDIGRILSRIRALSLVIEAVAEEQG
jgi:hypothetical protein